MGFLLITIVMFAILWFIMIRPQQKKEKERQTLISELKVGDHIVTYGGVCARITKLLDEEFVIESENSLLKVKKNAIAYKVFTESEE